MPAVDVDALIASLEKAGKAFAQALSTKDQREKMGLWTVQAGEAVARLKEASTPEDKAAAAKEVYDFEDAFNLKFGTTEIRAAVAASEALAEFAREAIPILLKTLVAVLA